MRDRKSESQGSIEYLVIIAVIIAITAIVVLFTTGFFSSSKKTGDVSKCMQAASRCYNEKAVSGSAECAYCEEACSGLSACKLVACREGDPSKVKVVEEAGLCSKFSFFDDFSSGFLNTSFWEIDPGYDKVRVENGELIVGGYDDAPENTEGRISSIPMFGEGMIEFKAKIVNNAPDSYPDKTNYNYASVSFSNHTADFDSGSSFAFYDFTWPVNGNIAVSDTLTNNNPDKVDISANNGVFERYQYYGAVKKSSMDAYDGYHTYTLTWKVVNGVNVNTFYIDCVKIAESNSSYPYPRKISIRGNYKEVHIDWIKACGTKV